MINQTVVLLVSNWVEPVESKVKTEYHHMVMLGLTKVVNDFGRQTSQAAGFQVVHQRTMRIEGQPESAVTPEVKKWEVDDLISAVKKMQDIQQAEAGE